MIGLGLISFDDNGRLYISHECKTCEKFPLEDINEPCMDCGISQQELLTVEKYITRSNKALDLMAKFGLDSTDDEDTLIPKEAFLLLSKIRLGEGLDSVTFVDIEQTDEIRALAEIADHMCNVIIYPTNYRVEEDFYDEVSNNGQYDDYDPMT